MEEDIQEKAVRLYSTVNKCLILAKAMRKDIIYIIGDIRSGKSTSFNLFVNHKSLIGASKSSLCYVAKSGAEAACVQEGYQSVTLVPNTRDIKLLGKQLTLIDMPGFQQNRSEVQKLLISFIFNCFFNHTANAKFLIVVAKNNFYDPKGDGFVIALQHFVAFFRKIDEQLRNSLYNSVGLLITCVQIKENYDSEKQTLVDRLKVNLDFYQSKYSHDPNKTNIAKNLIRNIVQHKRIQLFTQAKDGREPTEMDRNILQRMSKYNWKPFYYTPQLVKLLEYPYLAQFQKMTQNQKQTIKKCFQYKLQQFEAIQKSVANVVNQIIESENPDSSVLPQQIDLAKDSFFDQLQSLLNKNKYIQYKDEQDSQIIETLEEHRTKRIIGVSELFKLGYIAFLYQYQQYQKFPNYCVYLQSKFRDYLKLVEQYFCSSHRQKKLVTNILICYSCYFQHFHYLTEVEEHQKSQCLMTLRQSIRVGCQITKPLKEVLQNFVGKVISDLEIYFSKNLHQMNDVVKLLDNYSQQIDLIIRCAGLAKINLELCLCVQPAAKKGYLFDALCNFVKYVYIKLKQGDISVLVKRFISSIEAKFVQCLKSYINHQHNIRKGIQAAGLFRIQQLFHEQDIAREKNKENIKAKAEKLINFYLQFGLYSKAKDAKDYYQIAVEFQNNSKQKNLDKVKTSDYKIYTESQFVSFINTCFASEHQQIDEVSFFKQMNQYNCRTKMISNKSAGQFNIELPECPTYHQIYAYSRYLINKINKRKVILTFGKNFIGKTTACYFIIGKPMQIRNNTFDLPESQKEWNRINHNSKRHTKIFNIFEINQEELIIDIGDISPKSIIQQIIILSLLSQVLKHSSAIKILFMVTQESILSKGCFELTGILKHYLKIFNIKFSTLNAQILNSCALLVTCCNEKKKPQIVSTLKKLINKLKQLQDPDIQSDLPELYKSTPQELLILKRLIQKILSQSIPTLEKPINKASIPRISIQSAKWAYAQYQPTIVPKQKYERDRQQEFQRYVEERVLFIKDSVRALHREALQPIQKCKESLDTKKLKDLSMTGKKKESIQNERKKRLQQRSVELLQWQPLIFVENREVRRLCCVKSALNFRPVISDMEQSDLLNRVSSSSKWLNEFLKQIAMFWYQNEEQFNCFEERRIQIYTIVQELKLVTQMYCQLNERVKLSMHTLIRDIGDEFVYMPQSLNRSEWNLNSQQITNQLRVMIDRFQDISVEHSQQQRAKQTIQLIFDAATTLEKKGAQIYSQLIQSIYKQLQRNQNDKLKVIYCKARKALQHFRNSQQQYEQDEQQDDILADMLQQMCQILAIQNKELSFKLAELGSFESNIEAIYRSLINNSLKSEKAKLYCEAAKLLIERGYFKKANELLKQLTKKDPNEADKQEYKALKSAATCKDKNRQSFVNHQHYKIDDVLVEVLNFSLNPNKEISKANQL